MASPNRLLSIRTVRPGDSRPPEEILDEAKTYLAPSIGAALDAHAPDPSKGAGFVIEVLDYGDMIVIPVPGSVAALAAGLKDKEFAVTSGGSEVQRLRAQVERLKDEAHKLIADVAQWSHEAILDEHDKVKLMEILS